MSTCPFCPPPKDRVVEDHPLAVAINDEHPVSTGHVLVIPKRHVESWFDTTPEERVACFELVDQIKRRLQDYNSPDGYNIGINVGRAAGQTVSHLSVHVIPRYLGDMQDPSGGVRHVIPKEGNPRSTD